MSTQRVYLNGRANERLGRLRRSRRRADTAWRSHTFSDGVRLITLTATLNAETTARLRERLRQLSERDCDRLIVDVTAAVEPGKHAPAMLGAIFQEYARTCEVVVVVPRDSLLDGLLPARVAVAWSLSDAHRLLTIDRDRRVRPAPAGAISPGDRHTLAVRQALRWAAQRAGAGDYDGALRGLATIEHVEGGLPDGWQDRRQMWLAANGERATWMKRQGMR